MCQEYTIICNFYPACFRLSYEHNVSFNVGAYMFLFLTFFTYMLSYENDRTLTMKWMIEIEIAKGRKILFSNHARIQKKIPMGGGGQVKYIWVEMNDFSIKTLALQKYECLI